jgi:hypothetical protein
MITPTMNAARAIAGRSTGTAPWPPRANAKNNRLPVAKAVKTWPNARNEMASTAPAVTVNTAIATVIGISC